jgi:PKD repeat protein
MMYQMKQILLSAMVIFMLTAPISAQSVFSPATVRQLDESRIYKHEAMRYYWANLPQNDGDSYHISGTGIEFTAFGVGVLPSQHINYSDIQLHVKTGNGIWQQLEADFTPERIMRDDLYWTDLNFTADGRPVSQLEIRVSLPDGVHLDSLKFQAMNVDFNAEPAEQQEPGNQTSMRTGDCPDYPEVIPRSEWLDPYYTQPAYTPIEISAHHVVVHHGASPDTYTDGAAVVRSYWNYHVNSNGWSDIGYNYLTDKYGNIYKGRMNSDPLNLDMRGAHAGASNDESIGLNFLGNSDVTLPTEVQLDAVCHLLGWWFNKRGYDPTESADILLQSGGTSSIPRICGHKDVNIGGTACPGDALYAELPAMRMMTQAEIDACSQLPAASVYVQNTWQTSNFQAYFVDTDSVGAGLQERFWQVLDYNGQNWGANRSFGHFNDNFQTEMHPAWISQTGNWSISDGHLHQSDEAEGNTNLYIPLRQTDTTAYLYHWKMNIDGSGTNRRAGIHVFCDSASQSNRHNSYMVYFRADQDAVQLYRYVDNTYYLQTDDYADIDTNVFYDCKLYYNPATGELKAWLNDVLVSEWTDPSPYTEGRHLSLRTGNAAVMYDDVKVYTARGGEENISIGSENARVRWQSPGPETESCRIKSLVLDNQEHFSPVSGVNVKTDWSMPELNMLNDGEGEDMDEMYGLDSYSCNWTQPVDTNSGIEVAALALGTSPGAADVVGWTEMDAVLSHTFNGLDLTENEEVFASMRVTNGAGLTETFSSDGVIMKAGALADFSHSEADICQGESIAFANESQNEDSIQWQFEGGSPAESTAENPEIMYAVSGVYNVVLIAYYGDEADTLTISINVNLHAAPEAAFSVLEASLYLPDAMAGFVNESEHADQFYWDFGDGDFSTNEAPWHVYDQAGTYSVLLVAGNAWCPQDSVLKEDYLLVQEENGIESDGLADFEMFPNPVGDKLHVKIPDTYHGACRLRVSDMRGVLVLDNRSVVMPGETHSLDVSMLAEGLYLLELIPQERDVPAGRASFAVSER